MPISTQKHPENPQDENPQGPPTANRGVATGRLTSKGVDFLSVTVDQDAAFALISSTILDEHGRGTTGFQQSQWRTCIGGRVLRKFQPYQPSQQFGTSYESWEWASSSADTAAKSLIGKRVKPTRVDIAFDLEVDEDYTSDDYIRAIEEHATGKNFTLGISGSNGINTRYIGAATSPRRIRVYRKDKQDDVWSQFFGPTLRVELILREEQAENWWATWIDDPDKGYQVAAAHILAMTGHQLHDVTDIPQIIPPECGDEAATLFEFLKQYGPTLSAWQQAGIPVMTMAKYQRKHASRYSKAKAQRLVNRIKDLGAVQVCQIVNALMRAARGNDPAFKPDVGMSA